MQRSAQATIQYMGLTAKQHVLLTLPTNKIGGMMLMVRALEASAPITAIRPSLDAVVELKKLKSFIPLFNFVSLVPAQLSELVKNYGIQVLGQYFKKILVGGAAVSNPLALQLKEQSTCVIYESYGMTETISHIALRNLSKGESIFQLLPSVNMKVDTANCLHLQCPELWDGWLATNDVVKQYSHTSFEWLGRSDNVVNTGGIKVFPEKIELLFECAHRTAFHTFKTDG